MTVLLFVSLKTCPTRNNSMCCQVHGLMWVSGSQHFVIVYTFYFLRCKVCSHNSLQWRQNDLDGVSNHRPVVCLLNYLFRRRSKEISKLLVTGLCEENSPETGEFPALRASNAENASIWSRHHVLLLYRYMAVVNPLDIPLYCPHYHPLKTVFENTCYWIWITSILE